VIAVSPAAREWLAGFRPPVRLTVSEWAQAHRRLPETSAARGARWDNATAPYLVGIMDAALERGARVVSVAKAAQCGVSEALVNVVGYLIEHRPCPVLFVLPTASAAAAFGKERLSDAIRSTPGLRARVTDRRVPASSGLPESTQALRMYPGGYLALAAGGTPNSVARWSVKVAIMDDCDRVPAFVGAEGDPALLLQNRVTSYYDGIVMYVSTPVLRGGRIETIYSQSDQRRFFLQCPACSRWDFTTWKDEKHWFVKFDERNPATARLHCPCGHDVREPERMALVRAGEWRPTAEPLSRGNVGFHVPGMISPFLTLERMADRFLLAHGSGPRKLREFVCTVLGEGWRDEASSIAPDDLRARLEDF